MIPIVPIILAIVAIHLIFGVVGGLWILIPLFFLARFMFFRRGFRGCERSPRSCAVAAQRAGRDGHGDRTRAAARSPARSHRVPVSAVTDHLFRVMRRRGVPAKSTDARGVVGIRGREGNR